MRFSLLALPAAAVVIKRQDPEAVEPWACFHDDPETYTGTVSTANTGEKCMQWSDAAETFKTAYPADTKGESGSKVEGPYCRAFAGDAKPWCYVLGASDADVPKKEDCDVPQCPQDGVWGTDYVKEAEETAVKCTDETGAPAKDCDCSCDGVGGTSLIQIRENRWCHC